MTDECETAPVRNTRGAIVRLFGVILIILGSLNAMLSWRGGFELLSLPVAFIAVGIVLCVIGAILRGEIP